MNYRDYRIAIVHPSSNLDSVPSLYNTVCLLAEAGYGVDVYMHFDPAYVRPSFPSDRVELLPAFIPNRKNRRGVWQLLPGRLWQPLTILWRHRRAPYLCVIGVDPRGLSLAGQFARLVRVPLAYYSLELTLSYQLTTDQERKAKSEEIALSRQSTFVIIQDEERAQLLVQDNGLDTQRVICVANAPLGKASNIKTDYLRSRFGIPADKTIVLHAGSLHAWACAHQMIGSAREWPDEWVLICHTRHTADRLGREYLAALQYLAESGRVIFSTDPIPNQDYQKLVQSADIGVAFYCPEDALTGKRDDNIYHIGRSSGKLAYYLQAGLPVLVNKIPALDQVVSTYRCGEVVATPSSTMESIKEILGHYSEYSQNAVACFNGEFDFAYQFEKVLLGLRELENS